MSEKGHAMRGVAEELKTASWPLLQKKVAALLQIAEDQVTCGQTFKQLELDSLDMVELLMDLECAFNLDLLEGSLREVPIMTLTLGELAQRLDLERGHFT